MTAATQVAATLAAMIAAMTVAMNAATSVAVVHHVASCLVHNHGTHHVS